MFDMSFMRAEVWHALSVHFPIALLPASSITLLVALIVRKEYKKYWQNAAAGLLLAGTLLAWISVYTGDNADGIVSRKICDPTVLKDHELAGEATTYIFTAASLIMINVVFGPLRVRLHTIGIYLCFILMIIGSGYLVYAGHLGASLVYQQGAGVANHNVNCDDYQ